MSETIERELSSLLNKHGIDNECGVPDYILAAYLAGCIRQFKSSQAAIRRHTAKRRAITEAQLVPANTRVTGHAAGCPRFNAQPAACTCPPEETTT